MYINLGIATQFGVFPFALHICFSARQNSRCLMMYLQYNIVAACLALGLLPTVINAQGSTYKYVS